MCNIPRSLYGRGSGLGKQREHLEEVGDAKRSKCLGMRIEQKDWFAVAEEEGNVSCNKE
jgi:hypothetical protein